MPHSGTASGSDTGVRWLARCSSAPVWIMKSTYQSLATLPQASTPLPEVAVRIVQTRETSVSFQPVSPSPCDGAKKWRVSRSPSVRRCSRLLLQGVEKSFEIIGGALLLLDLYVLLGLMILAPIVVSILLFHLLMERNTLVIGVLPFLLWFFLAWSYRRQFAPLLVLRADVGKRHQ